MLLSVHLGNFNPVDLGACSSRNKTKMVERLRLLYGFVDCFNFTTNSAVEKHTSQKYAISASVVGIAKLFCQKTFQPGHPG